MKNITKKLFILTATVIMLCIISVVASAETYGDLTYTVSDGEVTITDCKESATEVEIPETIDGKPVTTIGDYAFYYCTGLTNITIPDSVTSIGNYAFSGCSSLTSVHITDIAAWCNIQFSSSNSNPLYYAEELYLKNELITELIIPDSVTNIGRHAFYNCTSLTSVTIGDAVTSIGNYAFRGCTGLKSVTIPESVTNIGNYAFRGCTGLKSVTIPESVTNIGYYAFSDCTGLTKINWNAKNISGFYSESFVFADAGTSGEGIEVIFGDNVETIPDYLFYAYDYDNDNGPTYYTGNIKNVTIPDSVTSIGSAAFFGCTNLISVTIPDSVTSIGSDAFNGCTGLTSVTIPDSVTSIGYYAFRNCTKLTKINWNAKNVSDFTSSFNVFYNAGVSGDGIEVIFGDNVEKIPAYCFYGEYNNNTSHSARIKSVQIGDSVTTIGSSAFYYCTELISVDIGTSVTTIGSSAFYYCTELKDITWNAKNVSDFSSSSYVFYHAGIYSDGIDIIFGDNVESIPAYCFYSFYNYGNAKSYIKNVTIGKSVKSIGSSAFYYCIDLTSVHITDIVAWYNIEFSNLSSNPLYYAKKLYLNNELITELIIPDSVTSIGNYAFYNCTGLTSVTIPESVTSIGNYAFSGCKGLASVKIPDSVTSIGEEAFKDCNSLEYMKLPFIGASASAEGHQAVFGYIFGYTTSFRDSYEDATYQYIDENTSLREYYHYYIPSSLKTIEILDATKIPNRAFYNCTMLTDISISNSVTTIGSSAFYNCTGLTSVHITDIVAWYNIEFSNSSSNPLYYAKKLYLNNELITEFIIPDSVTSIGNYAFIGCTGLTNLTIPDSVTCIGNYAFSDCTGLTSIAIPDSVTSIGNYAFSDCTGLTSITIPDSVTNIGRHAFYNCTSLTTINWNAKNVSDFTSSSYVFYNAGQSTDGIEVIFGDNVEEIPAYCFYEAKIKSVQIGGSVTGIGDSAFENCTHLISVTIGDSVTNINSYAFRGCTGLTSVTIPDSVVNIGNSAFRGCTGLKSVTIPDSVTSIGNYAFSGCSGLTNITIPDSVTSIGDDAFYNCTGLESATIGNSVTYISYDAFQNCTKLTKINWNAKNVSDFTSSSDVFYYAGQSGDGIEVIFGDNVEKIPAYCFYKAKVKSVTIGNSVTSIGNYAFYNCTGLTKINWNAKNVSDFTSSSDVFANAGTSDTGFEVIFGDNVEKIPACAFDGCTGLTSVTIPDSVKSIGSDAFSGCSGLTNITIPDSVTSIGDDAFSGCTGLTKINWNAKNISKFSSSGFYSVIEIIFGKYVESIPDDLFDNLQSLTTINVDSENENFTLVDGVLFSKTLRRLIKYPAKKQGTFYTVPDSVYRFAPNAFRDCKYLEKIVLNNNITIIDSNVFRNCIALKTITIPEQITSIGSSAFSGCTSLKSVYWNAQSVSDFTSSSDIFYASGNQEIGFIVTFGENVTKIPAYAFENCNKLKSVTISDSVKTIGADAFYGCSGLTDVIIGNGVTSIGAYAFYNCSNLTNITIPASVTSIGTYAFAGCTGLSKIEWNANRISSLSSYGYLFSNAGKNTANGGVEVVFGNEITTVPSYIFYNAYVKSVILPDNVKSIGNYAFYNCAPLTEIIIPDSVKSIGAYAFGNCTSLKNLSVPESVTTIGNAAFNNCSEMKHIYLYNPNCLTTDNVNNMIYQDTVIHSHSGYSVEAFANKYGYDFMELHTVSDEWTSSATCAEAGQKYHLCKYCDEKFDIEDAPATGEHTYTSEITTKSTCSVQGKRTYTCTVCKHIYTESIALDNNVHTYGEMEVIQNATCEEDGYKAAKCTGCGIEAPETATLPSSTYPESNHNYSNNINQEYEFSYPGAAKLHLTFSSSTAFESRYDYLYIYNADGSLYGKYSGTELAGKTITINGDSFKLKLTSDSSNTNYGFSFTKIVAESLYAKEIIPATGHTFTNETVDKNHLASVATCCSKATCYYKCEDCDVFSLTDAFEYGEYNAVNHVGGTEIRDAITEDCGNNGYTGDTYCLGCNTKISTGTVINATCNHNYSSVITTPATCKTTGVRTYTCTVCKDTYTETIAKDNKNHAGGTEIRDAVTGNCGNRGYTGDTYCLSCNKKVADGSVVPTTGKHNYTSAVTTVATCKTTGVRTYTCTVCKDTYTETIAKDNKNHAGGTEIRDAVAENCNNDGYTGDTYCLGCNAKIANGSVIPATDKHNYSSAITTPATCKSTGVRTYTCTVCKDTYTETIAIDNKNHAGGTEIRNKKSATCTSEGHTGDTYCVGCNTKIANDSVIAATGHSKGDWEVVTEAQIGAEGKEVQKCLVCGEVVAERVIPAIPEVTYTVGDANGDGRVNAIDARIILRISAQLDSMENYNQPIAVFDLTGDGKVNAIDARKALRIGAQLE